MVKRARVGLKFSEASHRYWLDGKPIPGAHPVCADCQIGDHQ